VTEGTRATILNVVGARPNFMKIAPLMRAFRKRPEFQPVLVHTGQHYDERMLSQCGCAFHGGTGEMVAHV
jgi:UDP-N-acetylglucosamine 2-epimerase